MDRNSFISLLQRFTASSPSDAEALLLLRDQYPYSQVLHALAARLTKDHSMSSAQSALHLAAIYAADRNVLKEIVTGEPSPQVQSTPVIAVVETIKTSVLITSTESDTEIIEKPTAKSVALQSFEAMDGLDVADQVMRDLNLLITSKHNFEMLFVEYAEVEATKPSRSISTAAQETKGETQTIVASSTESGDLDELKPKGTKSRKARIIELARSMGATDAENTDDKVSKKKWSGKKMEHPDELIDEIEATKDVIIPESELQKKQIELIDQFIKIQPSISSARERQQVPVADLNPVKSGEFGDNIVSETLVEILIKQGKKDKAVEVLKKLIWKYPQKKAYFASQIEDLKK